MLINYYQVFSAGLNSRSHVTECGANVCFCVSAAPTFGVFPSQAVGLILLSLVPR